MLQVANKMLLWAKENLKNPPPRVPSFEGASLEIYVGFRLHRSRIIFLEKVDGSSGGGGNW